MKVELQGAQQTSKLLELTSPSYMSLRLWYLMAMPKATVMDELGKASRLVVVHASGCANRHLAMLRLLVAA